VDFAGEWKAVEECLVGAGFRAAVIGGVALTAYGNPRLTLDLDVITDSAAQGMVIAFMEAQGFVTLHRSVGYSNHRHAERGRVDFMYVMQDTADRLFGATRTLPGPGGRAIPVPKPEHLVAMKVQAMKDAPDRVWQDLVDIAYLLQIEGIDREEARGYFVRAGLEERWHELVRPR
jgi:Nucleotidyl transferase AbiEii toxin, Type IV TA system